MTEPPPLKYRTAAAADLPAIDALIAPHVRSRKLLPRDHDDLVQLVRNGFVAEAGGEIVGFAAVEIYSKKLAELLCLAVDQRWQGQRIGQQLVAMCIDRARAEGVREMMAISSAENFFSQCGFDYTLPQEKKAFFISTGEQRQAE
jgi:amino-acid N-acetyltransferase